MAIPHKHFQKLNERGKKYCYNKKTCILGLSIEKTNSCLTEDSPVIQMLHPN
jgi:hypothetical protein